MKLLPYKFRCKNPTCNNGNPHEWTPRKDRPKFCPKCHYPLTNPTIIKLKEKENI